MPAPPVTCNDPVVVLVLPVPVVTVNGPTIPNESAIVVAPVAASIVNTSVNAVFVILKSASSPFRIVSPSSATVNASVVTAIPPFNDARLDDVIVVTLVAPAFTTPNVVVPVTSSVSAKVVACVTSNVPAISVLPVSAATLNLSVLIATSPSTNNFLAIPTPPATTNEPSELVVLSVVLFNDATPVTANVSASEVASVTSNVPVVETLPSTSTTKSSFTLTPPSSSTSPVQS